MSNSTIHLKFIFLKSQAKEVVEEQETPDLLMQNFDPPDLFLDPLSPSQPAPALPPNMRDIPKSHSSRSGTDLVRQNGGSPFGTNFNGTMYSKSSVDRPILSPPPLVISEEICHRTLPPDLLLLSLPPTECPL